jgi:hypothetical protein
MLPLGTKGRKDGLDLSQFILCIGRVFPEPHLALDLSRQSAPPCFFLYEEAVEVFNAGTGRLRHGCTGKIAR